MQLQEAGPMLVVENQSSGTFYRTTEIVQRAKSRIRPLELFPTGLLIPKSTDTLVATTTVVRQICRWQEPVRVEGKPTHTRDYYEAELVERQQELEKLQTRYAELPKSGRGHLSRGSHANKILACTRRIETLYEGLGMRESMTEALSPFTKGDRILLPSGMFGTFVRAHQMGDVGYAAVKVAGTEHLIPVELLRDAEQHRLCVA
jgi:hypothetical protein